jgi:ABC-type sugar transport system substrate-binding protein
MDIEVVTFDSDSKQSERKLHIGTDDLAFGDMLGKVLLQLEPKGGDYSVITAFPSQNLVARVKGLKNVLDGTKWNYFGPEKGVNGKGSRSESLLAMSQILDDHHSKYPNPGDRPPFAIVPVGAWPMLDTEGWKEFNKKDEDTTLICGDAFLSQIEMLKLDYVAGLVGQLPAEMGRQSVSKFEFGFMKRCSIYSRSSVFILLQLILRGSFVVIRRRSSQVMMVKLLEQIYSSFYVSRSYFLKYKLTPMHLEA